MVRGWLLLVLAACAHGHPRAPAKPSGDDLTLYRDVALVRQRIDLDGTSATVAVPEGVTADDALVIYGSATVRSGKLGTLIVDFLDGGHHSITLGYITDKLHWDVAYTMTATAARDRAVLRGALAIHNTSTITVRGAAHVIDSELGAWRTRRATQVASELGGPSPDSTPPPAARDLGMLQLAPGETRVDLVEGGPRRMHAVLVYDPIGTKLDNPGAVPLRDPSLGVTEQVSPKISESFEIARGEDETAGLPAGPVRLLERRDDGSLAVLGQSRLFDPETRRSNVDTIAIGTADGVTGKRERRELTDEESRHRLVEEFVVEIDNTRPRPVDVLVREHLYRGQTWALAYWSVDDIHQEGAQSINMRTRVPAHGQVKILYVVVYTLGLLIARIRELTIQYGKRTAVDGLDLELAAGEIALLLGPNGAGKSTTLAAMAGVLLPAKGTITVEDQDVTTARGKVGFADQPPQLYDFFTVEEHVGFVAEARGADAGAAKAVLGKLGLEKIAQRPCRELSFGMRQRVGLAAALVGPVKLVLLDETLNGLDPHAARAARATLRAAADAGAAILMSTHLLGVAERLCDRILVMDRGKLVTDRRGDDVKTLLAKGPTAIEDLYVSLIADAGVE